jgi:hypothetical protein
MSRRNDPFIDFYTERGLYSQQTKPATEQERYYAIKRQLLEDKLNAEAQKQKQEENKQREETLKLLEFYKSQVEDLKKAHEQASDQSQASTLIKGPVDVRSVQNTQHGQTFIDHARQLIKSNNTGDQT